MTYFSDTHPEAEAVLLDLLRQAGVAKRASMLWSLTSMAVSASRRAIKQANPQLSHQELDLLFVELNYGRQLADQVRQRIMS